MAYQEKLAKWLAETKPVKATSRESGWHPEPLRRLSELCRQEGKLRIYRRRKPEAIQYENRRGFRAKPMAVKLKSESTGLYAGLVMVAEKRESRSADERAQIEVLLANGYRLEPTGRTDGLAYLVDPKGSKLYSDIDPMGTYRQVASGGFVRCEPDSPREMNAKLGRKIWDDPDMERAWGGGAQDSYWKQKADKIFEMRPDPEVKAKLQGRFDDATLMAMGAQVRSMSLQPKADERFLVAMPDSSLYMMNLTQLRDFYKTAGIWWPY